MRCEINKPIHCLLIIFGCTLLATLLWGASFLLDGETRVQASGHREAPLISKDPLADNTDSYLFISPENGNNLVLIGSWVPFEAPESGPLYYHWDPTVLYDLYVDNDGDAKADITYTLSSQISVVNPNTFLYNVGPINTLTDADRNYRQYITVTEHLENGTVTVLVGNKPTTPAHIGSKSTPNYDTLESEAIYPFTTVQGTGKLFAGQTDDPAWLDLQFFDLLTLRGQAAPVGYSVGDNTPTDSLAGFNVHSLVIELPITHVTQGSETVVGMWAAARRSTTRVLGALGAQTHSTTKTQVSRLGMPLVNEVVIPLALKDALNSIVPSTDAVLYTGGAGNSIRDTLQNAVEDPEVGTLLCLLYQIPLPGDANKDCSTEFTPGTPRSGRGDIFDIFLTGFKLARSFDIDTKNGKVTLPPGTNINQPAGVVPAEMLRINTALKGDLCSPTPSRLGLLGGDICGFPNGRRLGDDVFDIFLQTVAGGLYSTIDGRDAGFSFNSSLSNILKDAINQNDLPFRNTFPYLALAQSGQAHSHQTARQVRSALAAAAQLPLQSSAPTDQQAVLTGAQDGLAESIDNYLFIAPGNQNNLVLVGSWPPLAAPESGPNYYEWDDSAFYDLYIDNDGDARSDITYTLTSRVVVANPLTFLYNTGLLVNLTSSAWNRRQYITVTEQSESGTTTVLVGNKLTTPAPIGSKSTPDYPGLEAEAIYSFTTAQGSGKLFAGQTDAPAWLDLQVFDGLTLRGQGAPLGYSTGDNTPTDSLMGFNAHSLVLELPITHVTQGAEPVIGMWTGTRRFSTRTLGALGSQTESGPPVQIARSGMPLVNRAILPLALKDLFSGTPPRADMAIYTGALGATAANALQRSVEDPELGTLLCGLYGVSLPGDADKDCHTSLALGTPRSGRGDFFDFLITGIKFAKPITIQTKNGEITLPAATNLNQPTAVSPGEMLRINTAIKGDLCSPTPHRLGLVGGDICGFPNGRRPTDDVLDITLLMAAGVLYPVVDGRDNTFVFDPALLDTLSDAVNQNDVPFRATFPYLALAQSGQAHVHQAPTATPTNTPTATPTNTSTATSTATATPTPTATPTTPATGEGDGYEADNTCAQAQTLVSDGSTQDHTFHTAGDTDWVRVETQAAVRYRVEVQVPADSPADVDLELHPACGQLPNPPQNPSFSPNIRLDFQAPQTGPIFLRLTNHTATVAGAHVTYQITVRVLDENPPDRALIIVAGRLKGSDRLQSNIHYVTGRIYALFQKNGYDSSNMQYLATDSTLPGYTGAASKENLRAAITTWAAQQLEPNGVLTLYLIDHGKPDLFFLDELNGQRVTPSELDEWLTQLESQVLGVKVNVIIEACQAGSFIALPASISRGNRLVVTSTTADADAKASYEGAYFSDHFLTGLAQGSNVYSSFFEARRVAKQIFALQEAWVDGDGDGQPNELEDAAAAASRGFNYPGTFDDPWPPHIFSGQGPTSLVNASGEIRADVRDDVKVRLVWGVVYPPDYVPPPAGQELQAEVLPTFLLADQGDNQFAGKYTGFTQAGVYRIIIHAEDNDGLAARPVVIEVDAGGRVYLPVVER